MTKSSLQGVVTKNTGIMAAPLALLALTLITDVELSVVFPTSVTAA